MTNNQTSKPELDPHVARTDQQLWTIQSLLRDKKDAAQLSNHLSEIGQPFAAYLLAVLTSDIGARNYALERSFPRLFIGEYRSWEEAIEDLLTLRADLNRSLLASSQDLAVTKDDLSKDEAAFRAQLRERLCVIETPRSIYVFRKENTDTNR